MLTKKNYLANETHFICDVCSEAVINPLCPICITTEIEAWLTLYPNLRAKLNRLLEGYLQKINNQTEEATACIKCKNKRASVCPYCFTEHVLGKLKKLEVNHIVLKEFFEFFNFDFNHTGYSKEAEELGVI
jgi:hypothetical protein